MSGQPTTSTSSQPLTRFAGVACALASVAVVAFAVHKWRGLRRRHGDASRTHRSRSRVRRREEGDGQQAAASHLTTNEDGAATGSSQSRPSAAGASSTPSDCEQSLGGQTRPRSYSPLESLADVELQLVMQFLDTDDRLKTARCSRRLVHAVSHPFSWKGAGPFVVEARTPDDVERIRLSLVRFVPIHLRCLGLKSFVYLVPIPHLDLRGGVGGIVPSLLRYKSDQLHLASLERVASLSQLHGLELLEGTDTVGVERLLQHPCTQRLQSLRVDRIPSFFVGAAATMRLIVRLPRLRTLDLCLHRDDVVLLRSLADAPALTDLTLRWSLYTNASMVLLEPITRMAGLRRLCLEGVPQWSGNTFRAFFSSPSMRQLQHLQLRGFFARASAAAEYAAAFGAMQQLQSLTLSKVISIEALLPHLHHFASLRLLTIPCRPATAIFLFDRIDWLLPPLLDAAPQLRVILLLPPSLDHWLDMDRLGTALAQEQWNELHRMADEMERVTVVYEESAEA